MIGEYCSITNDELCATNLQSSINWDDEKAFVSGMIGDNHFEWSFNQDSDWVNMKLHKKMAGIAKRIGLGEFLLFPAEDQCAEIVYLETKIAKILKNNGYFG